MHDVVHVSVDYGVERIAREKWNLSLVSSAVVFFVFAAFVCFIRARCRHVVPSRGVRVGTARFRGETVVPPPAVSHSFDFFVRFPKPASHQMSRNELWKRGGSASCTEHPANKWLPAKLSFLPFCRPIIAPSRGVAPVFFIVV